MKKTISIGKKLPHPLYIPKDLVREGFIGKTEILADAKTITILHPEASDLEITESLKIILKDHCLRQGYTIEFKIKKMGEMSIVV